MKFVTLLIILFSFGCAHHQSGRYVYHPEKGWVFQKSKVGIWSQTHREKIADSPFIASSDFLWPLPSSFRVTSHYGKRGRKHHDGIDIASHRGAAIVASKDGKVVFSGRMSGYGKIVVIKHDSTYHTVYAHNSKNLVSKHQYVSKGQVIAKVGSTGRSSGPHLHYEIRKNNKKVNPLSYLSKKRTFASN